MGEPLPLVSVIIPERNEARFIEETLSSVFAQDYASDCLEVLLVDGQSDDDTVSVARRVAQDHGWAVRDCDTSHEPFRGRTFTVVDNPGRTAPTALNRGLAASRGDVLVRVDGHCMITETYVSASVAALDRWSAAGCVGGRFRNLADSPTARAIAAAQTHPFGVGDSDSRTGPAEPKRTDTVIMGTYGRDVVEDLGGWDEELVRNQDDEFNFRLIQSGREIWYDPSIEGMYYGRSTLRGLWRQYRQYGSYKVLVIKKRGAVASPRHLVPGMLVLGLAGSTLLGIALRRRALAVSLSLPYAAAVSLVAVHTANEQQVSAVRTAGAFATLHLSYGLGFLEGMVKWRRWRPPADSSGR